MSFRFIVMVSTLALWVGAGTCSAEEIPKPLAKPLNDAAQAGTQKATDITPVTTDVKLAPPINVEPASDATQPGEREAPGATPPPSDTQAAPLIELDPASHPTHPSGPKAADSKPEQTDTEVATPIEVTQETRSVREALGGWVDFLFSDGNHAQWIIAFTSVCAFLLSAWAVWLLRATLGATREAVKSANNTIEVTRDLGEAQIRAYLYCRSAKYRRTSEILEAIVEIGNAGQSPASEVSIKGDVTINLMVGHKEMPRLQATATSVQTEAHCQPITANGSVTDELVFFFGYSFRSFEPGTESEEGFDQELEQMAIEQGNQIEFYFTVKWRDVFGNWHEFPLSLTADIGPGPTNSKKTRSNAGKLDIRMEDAHLRIKPENWGSEWDSKTT